MGFPSCFCISKQHLTSKCRSGGSIPVLHHYLNSGDGVDGHHHVVFVLCGVGRGVHDDPDPVRVAVEPAGANGQPPPGAGEEGRDDGEQVGEVVLVCGELLPLQIKLK